MSIPQYYGATGHLMVKHSDHLKLVDQLKAESDQLKNQEIELKAENEALRKDAERYRWLKSRPVNTPTHGPDLAQWDDHQGDALRELFADEAIDAAMGKGEQS